MDSRHPPPPTSRNRILLLAALVLLVGGVLLLSRVLPHARNPARYSGEYVIVGSLDDSHQHSALPLSESPTSVGEIRLKDFRLKPLTLTAPGLSLLRIVYQDGLVTIQNQATQAPVWSGALAFASFSVQTMNGLQILRDSKGRVIWTNAAGAVKPDLLFQRAVDGRGALIDKAGTALWAGRLPPTQAKMTTGTCRAVPFTADGVHIDRVGGIYGVTDDTGRRLWSGRLPVKPLIAFRFDRVPAVLSLPQSVPRRGDTRWFSLEGVPGVVMVANTHGKPLGQIPIQLIAIHEAVQMPNDAHRLINPFHYLTPDGLLMANGTLLLTYRNASGMIVRRSKVFRTANGRVGNIG